MSPLAAARDLRNAPAGAAGAEAPSLRKAVLLLHGLPEGDREWMLSQLSREERARILPLLGELRQLGIPSDRSLLDEALASTPRPQPVAAAVSAPGASSQGASDRERLERTDPARLAELLRDEPVRLVARLLAMAEWPWREALLQDLGKATRIQIEEILAEEKLEEGAALREQLLAALARRLTVEGDSSRPRARRSLRRWLASLGKGVDR